MCLLCYGHNNSVSGLGPYLISGACKVTGLTVGGISQGRLKEVSRAVDCCSTDLKVKGPSIDRAITRAGKIKQREAIAVMTDGKTKTVLIPDDDSQ